MVGEGRNKQNKLNLLDLPALLGFEHRLLAPKLFLRRKSLPALLFLVRVVNLRKLLLRCIMTDEESKSPDQEARYEAHKRDREMGCDAAASKKAKIRGNK